MRTLKSGENRILRSDYCVCTLFLNKKIGPEISWILLQITCGGLRGIWCPSYKLASPRVWQYYKVRAENCSGNTDTSRIAKIVFLHQIFKSSSTRLFLLPISLELSRIYSTNQMFILVYEEFCHFPCYSNINVHLVILKNENTEFISTCWKTFQERHIR